MPVQGRATVDGAISCASPIVKELVSPVASSQCKGDAGAEVSV